jgi:hypothetical protein
MKTNVGGIDKILRIVVGLALIALAALGSIGAWGWIGIVPLLTGLFGVCPAYSLLGMNTCPAQEEPLNLATARRRAPAARRFYFRLLARRM